ncbi:MAG TPA: xanthine dehydrogenase family protein molybdopterin-binding subunit [Gammaproteobacteria bacterium]|nr:xanthine dehydrogenase family protein molybdopterin-binding subunit [Gammaproteobacteria bacterium]
MSEAKWVGARIERKQDLRLVTGHGRYTDDLSMPGMLHAAMLRSPHAHARIKAIDVSRARALPGVHAVLTGEDAKRYWGPLPPTIDIGMKVPQVYGLATEKVYYMGEPVVAVAADSRYLAEDALEYIDVAYEALPAVSDTEAALAPGAPLLYPEWGDNVQCDWGMSVGPVAEVFAQADRVFEFRIPQHRYSGVSLEGRAALAAYDPYGRKLTLHCSTQSPNLVRTLVAQTFRFPEHDVQVIAPDVGGGYGNKLQADAEVIPCLLSLATGRPVKWTESRQENLLSGMQCRDYVWYLKVAISREGVLQGLDAAVYGNVGCDGTCHAAGAGKFLVACGYLPGPYKWQAFKVATKVAVSNKAPSGAYRGYGKDIANFPLEVAMNRMADALGLSPVEIRRRNFVGKDEFPYQQISGPIYDSGDYAQCLAKLVELVDYEAVRRRQAEQNGGSAKYLGIGIASMLEPSGGAVPNCIFNSYEVATVRLVPEGGVLVLTGHQDIGQGTETTLCQVVADELGVTPDDVRIVYGDTNAVPYGMGPWSSRGATFNVSCVAEATRRLKSNLLEVVAQLWGCEAAGLAVVEGRICEPGGRTMTLRELGNQLHLWPGAFGIVPKHVTNPFEVTHYWTSPIASWVPDAEGRIRLYTTHPSGSSAVVVEVDVETGKVEVKDVAIVDDCGVIINPTIVEGQLHGGYVQGIGGALLEEFHYDERGQLWNTDLTSYLHPLATDVPDVRCEHVISPSPYTALGTKGMGEGSAIMPVAAVVNAVEDALKPFGVRVSELPLTPERVIRLLKTSPRWREIHGADA